MIVHERPVRSKEAERYAWRNLAQSGAGQLISAVAGVIPDTKVDLRHEDRGDFGRCRFSFMLSGVSSIRTFGRFIGSTGRPVDLQEESSKRVHIAILPFGNTSSLYIDCEEVGRVREIGAKNDGQEYVVGLWSEPLPAPYDAVAFRMAVKEGILRAGFVPPFEKLLEFNAIFAS